LVHVVAILGEGEPKLSEPLRSPLSVFSWKSQAQFLEWRGVSPMVYPPGLAGVNHPVVKRNKLSSLDSTSALFLLTPVAGAILISSRGFSKWQRSKETVYDAVTNAPVTLHVDLIKSSRDPQQPQRRQRRNGYQRSYWSHIRTRARGHSGTQVLSHSHSFTEGGAHGGPPGTQNQHTVWAEGRNRRVHVHLSVPYRSEATGWPITPERCGGGY